MEKCTRNQSAEISVCIVCKSENISGGYVWNYTYYSQSNLHCKCLHIAMLMQTRCLFICPNEREFLLKLASRNRGQFHMIHWFFYGMSCLNSPFFLDHWSCSYLHLFHGTIWEHQNDEKDLKGRYQF